MKRSESAAKSSVARSKPRTDVEVAHREAEGLAVARAIQLRHAALEQQRIQGL